jgi:hypothetical protein
MIEYVAVHPTGPSVIVVVHEYPLGLRRFEYQIRTWPGCSADLAMVFLEAWRDWDKRLKWGVNPDEVPAPGRWTWATAPYDDEDSFEAYCDLRMRRSRLPR